MRVRWLGWAGAEYEHDGETVVVDPLADPAATFAGFGAAASDVELPEVVAAVGRRAWPAWSATCTATTPTPAPCWQRSRRAPSSTTPAVGRCEPGARPGRARARRGEATATAGRRPGSRSSSARSPAPRCRRSTGSATRRSPGSSRRAAAASYTSATPSFTAAGGRWRGGPGPFDVVLAPDERRRSSTSPTSSRRARSRPPWSRSRRRSPASCSAPAR